jgi:hypothetical protein
MKQQTTEKKNSQLVSLPFVAIVMATIVSYMLIFATPVIGEFPVEITEEVKVLAVTEKGVVFETSTGVVVVTDQYNGESGDIIEVTYSVPAKYLDAKRKQQASFDAFHPDS